VLNEDDVSYTNKYPGYPRSMILGNEAGPTTIDREPAGQSNSAKGERAEHRRAVATSIPPMATSVTAGVRSASVSRTGDNGSRQMSL